MATPPGAKNTSLGTTENLLDETSSGTNIERHINRAMIVHKSTSTHLRLILLRKNLVQQMHSTIAMAETMPLPLDPAEFEASQNRERSLVRVARPPSPAELSDADTQLVIGPNQNLAPSRHRKSRKRSREYEGRKFEGIQGYAVGAKYNNQRPTPSRRSSTRTHNRPRPSGAERDAFENPYGRPEINNSKPQAPIPPASRPSPPLRRPQTREPSLGPSRPQQPRRSQRSETQDNTKRTPRSSSQARGWEDRNNSNKRNISDRRSGGKMHGENGSGQKRNGDAEKMC
ncbi:hypothetical protein B0T22DRAFT_438590 [Podospora appendiculata]|uniref:Uncharacterized protein n=1 Tax=Podospora appendiculata TaxID=314037 RepID=A0AAE1CIJ0_9PEZI|nr:hypothetical protein B0T22DRAFT_438590 [Podospora appendiculata]